MYAGSGVANGAKRYYRADPQGSIIALTDYQGNVVDTYTYDAYGMPDNPGGNAIRYTGRRWDAETGLYYYRARMLSPAIGRFLQTDPVGYGDNVNLYGYVGNDPVNGNDPTGLTTVAPRPRHCERSAFCSSISYGTVKTSQGGNKSNAKGQRTAQVTGGKTQQNSQPGQKNPISRGNQAILTDKIIAAILCGEACSFRPQNGNKQELENGLKAIINTIINADEQLGSARNQIAGTAQPVNRTTADAFTQRFLQRFDQFVADVRAERFQGIDSSGGNIFFNFRDANQQPNFRTAPRSTDPNQVPALVFGPFKNVAPTSQLGSTDIFLIIFTRKTP